MLKAEDYDPTMFRNLIDVNLTGSFLVSQLSGRKMIHAGKDGSIIFLSSIAGGDETAILPNSPFKLQNVIRCEK